MSERFGNEAQDEKTRPKRQVTFDQAAELYEKVRPKYPARLFDDLVELSGLPSNARVLEIGTGTGQATKPLAQRGYTIDCVELGRKLAGVASRELADFPKVSIHVSAFEEWSLPKEPYDLVLAATAFHWIEPDKGFTKSAAALNQGGALAVIESIHAAGGDDDFFEACQPLFAKYRGESGRPVNLPAPESVVPEIGGLVGSDLFYDPITKSYQHTITYTAQGYVNLLNTYSDHLSMPADRRKELDAAIAELINARFGGSIRKSYVFELIVAKKR